MTHSELLATCAGGIIMSAESVRATREGRKTQTRRVVSPQPDAFGLNGGKLAEVVPSLLANSGDMFDVRYELDNPMCLRARYQPGKRYYVKETWQRDVPGCVDGLSYKADHDDPCGDGPANPMIWRSPMYMPRSAARYVIEVDAVRVQHLQDITEEDARAEGFETIRDDYERCMDTMPKAQYAKSWDAINGKRAPWASNPWVWAITYHLVNP